jgi:hypothetical protein
MKPSDEIAQAAQDMQRARMLLLHITRALRNAMDAIPRGEGIEDEAMLSFVDASTDLETPLINTSPCITDGSKWQERSKTYDC